MRMLGVCVSVCVSVSACRCASGLEMRERVSLCVTVSELRGDFRGVAEWVAWHMNESRLI